MYINKTTKVNLYKRIKKKQSYKCKFAKCRKYKFFPKELKQ